MQNKQKKNLSPSRLSHLRGILEGGAELTEGQRSWLIKLIDANLENKQDPAIALSEWFRKGQPLVDAFEAELVQIRLLTDADGDLISKAALQNILNGYKVATPLNAMDNSINWLIDRIEKDAETLPTKRGSAV